MATFPPDRPLDKLRSPPTGNESKKPVENRA
jgi:hypothetical protein